MTGFIQYFDSFFPDSLEIEYSVSSGKCHENTTNLKKIFQWEHKVKLFVRNVGNILEKMLERY